MSDDNNKSLNKFDRCVSGLQGGNNLAAKVATIQNIEPITGDIETYTVQVVRAEYKINIAKGWNTETVTRVGDFIVLHFLDKDGPMRLVIPPRVTETIARQSEMLKKKDDERKKKNRSARMKEVMAERMAAGFVPNFTKK